MKTNLTDEAFLNNWYDYAAQQDGFTGKWLEIFREKQKITLEQQQRDFGASSQDFIRLQGMPLPRNNQFTRDARRIADICHLSNPSAFVQVLLLVRSLNRSVSMLDGNTGYSAAQFTPQDFYQAAYDADEDLDKPIDEG